MMEASYIHQNRIKQIFFLICIVSLGLLLARELSAFLPAMLGAITLYMLMRKPLQHITQRRGWSVSFSAWMLMLGSFLVIMMPISAVVSMLSSKISYAIAHSNELSIALDDLVNRIEAQFGIKLLSEENIGKVGNIIAKTIPQMLSATFNTLATIFFMYFILYFMLVNGQKMEQALYEHIPLKDENVHKLGFEIENMVLSNAIGIPVIGFLQGVVAIIGYYIIGVKEPWFWFVITCITAMLPVVGAALAYVPLAIIFFANNQIWQGFFMLVYGFGVIGTVDNIFRFALARKIGNVHPLITVFGVIIGLQLFGFIGLIFGPLLISLFILLLRIYANEFFVKHREAGVQDMDAGKNS